MHAALAARQRKTQFLCGLFVQRPSGVNGNANKNALLCFPKPGTIEVEGGTPFEQNNSMDLLFEGLSDSADGLAPGLQQNKLGVLLDGIDSWQ